MTAGCGLSHDAPARDVAVTPSAPTSSSAAASTQPTTSSTPTRQPPSAASTLAAAPSLRPFTYSTSAVTTAQLGKSWHSGCPVEPSSLRNVRLTYAGFDHATHTGTLVVNARYVGSIVSAFQALYEDRFPIRRMVPIAAYGGDDNASMAADNTSGFNCRYAVANGPKQWSMHAYGEAIDVNTLENPYQLDGVVYPPAGRPYLDRSNVRPGMAVPGSAVVRAFASVGWGWGGNWSSSPDYQHFSNNGR
jgi:hypothetical protein